MRFRVVALLALVLWVVGCGGSGEGSSSSSASTGTVAVFLTDGMDGSDHVFVRLHRIELVAGSDSTVVFDDPAGAVVDVRSLRDESGQKFLLLASDAVPRGQYTSVALTLGKTLQTFEREAANAVEKEFDDSLDAGKGVVRLRIPLEAALQVGVGRSDLVLDFDLSSWTENGGKVLPVVKPLSERPPADLARYVEHAYYGTIGSVGGRGSEGAFDLRTSGGTIRVRLSGSTHVAQADGTASPVLKSGARARIAGKFDPQSGQLIADSVSLGDGAGAGGSWVVGKPRSIDSAQGKLEVDWRSVGGTMPAGRTIRVTVGDGTMLRGAGGERQEPAQFWEALASAESVRVEGVADGASIAATAIGILGPSGPPLVSAEGAVSVREDGDWELRLTAWDGFAAKADDRLVVRLAESCRFFSSESKPITREQFLQASAEGSPRRVRVAGRFNGTLLVADQVREVADVGNQPSGGQSR